MRHYILLIVIMIFISGCKKEETPEPEPQQDEIMKINFTNGYIPDPFEVIVFISNPDGSLIADTAFSENGLHSVMNENPEIDIPDTFMVTIVRYDLYWHSLLIRMNTFQGVSPSEWAIRGMEPDTIGKATVEFTSIPEFSGLVLYSNQGYYNYTTSTNPQTCMIYDAQDDFYLKMKTDVNGPRFKWMDGFTAGSHYVLDLESMEIPNSTTIPFPFEAGYYEGRLWGFGDNSFDLGKAFLFDLVLAGIEPKNEIILNYPSGRYENYRTNIMIRESFFNNALYFFNTTGAIPSALPLIDADITGAQMSENEIILLANGNFETQKAFLYFMSANNEIFEWNIYAPSSAEKIYIPDLSPLLGATFPSIDTADFVLKNTELIDFHELNSFREMLQVMFDKNNPLNLDQLDYSSVSRLEQ